MFRLEVTGATISELVRNTLAALQINATKPSAAVEAVAEPLANPAASDPPPELTEPKKRGRKPKADAAQVDIEQAIAEAPKKPEVHDDPIPDFLQRKDDAAPVKQYTIDDCLNAVRQVYENYIARQKAAGIADEDALMSGKIKYAKQLVYGFDVQKVKDLKPEQYRAFIDTAAGYITGETKLKAEG